MKIIPSLSSTVFGRTHSTRFHHNRQPGNNESRKRVYPHRIDISPAAKFRYIMKSMGTEGKTELRTFRNILQQTIQSETFNAAEMAEKAPKGLKSWAEKNKTNLEEMLNRWANLEVEIKNRFSIFPSDCAGSGESAPCCHHDSTVCADLPEKYKSERSTDLRIELQSFRQEVFEAVESDTFDAAAMVEKAPDGVKAWAEENDIDLVELLNRWANRAQVRAELQSFRQEVFEAVESDTFDAAAMVEKATEEVKVEAEGSETDLDDQSETI